MVTVESVTGGKKVCVVTHLSLGVVAHGYSRVLIREGNSNVMVIKL